MTTFARFWNSLGKTGLFWLQTSLDFRSWPLSQGYTDTKYTELGPSFQRRPNGPTQSSSGQRPMRGTRGPLNWWLMFVRVSHTFLLCTGKKSNKNTEKNVFCSHAWHGWVNWAILAPVDAPPQLQGRPHVLHVEVDKVAQRPALLDEPEVRFLRCSRLDLTRTLLYIKNNLGQTYAVIRTGFWGQFLRCFRSDLTRPISKVKIELGLTYSILRTRLWGQLEAGS